MPHQDMTMTTSSTKTKRYAKKLYDILEKSKVSNGNCNLVSMSPPGRYNVNTETMEEVIDLYSHIYKKNNLSLAEIPKEISYFKIDVDLDTEKKT